MRISIIPSIILAYFLYLGLTLGEGSQESCPFPLPRTLDNQEDLITGGEGEPQQVN